MYRAHFGLLKNPFEMTPDPSFLHLGEAHREAFATLVYAVRARKGFVLLTGEVGTGKTTLVHALLARMDSNSLSAFIFNPRLDPLDFFRLLFDEYEIKEKCSTKAEYLLALNRFLIARIKQNLATVLIVDEAQNLSPEMLEEIRLLSNLETATSKLLQIVLVGQPELKAMLARPELRQLRQRIVLRFDLQPMAEAEMREYVNERLSLAGYTGDGLFKKSAFRELYRVTGGVPRLINVVSDGALLSAYAQDAVTIESKIVRDVANDLELDGAPPRSTTTRRPVQAGWFRGITGLFR